MNNFGFFLLGVIKMRKIPKDSRRQKNGRKLGLSPEILEFSTYYLLEVPKTS
jgi:hypothetical protein